MTAAAVVLSIVWFLTAFVVRILIQIHRTGESGIRFDTASVGPAATWSKVGFLTSTLLVGLAPVLVATGAIDMIGGSERAAMQWIGLVVAVAGIVATFVSQLAMGRSWRIGVDPAERTDLVTAGIFSIVRNPIFSTMAMTAAGLTLILPTGPGLIGLAILVVALEVQVRVVEEPYLGASHGAEYEWYASHVGRFVPGVGRSAVGSSSPP